MHPDDIDRHPERATTEVTLSNGQTACLRPLSANDGGILGEYFLGLSKTTRGFYGPHPFDQATADKICGEIRHPETLRLLATIEPGNQERIVAYFLVFFGILDGDRPRYNKLGISLDQNTDCTLAPSVADAFQNTGVGSLVMTHLTKLLRRCGRKRVVLWGGVQERNERGVRFYKKFGFQKIGEFMSKNNNYDMIADL